MAEQRRTSRGGPGGSRRPGQRGNPRARAAVAPTPGSTGPEGRRPRLTGRAAILVLVLAVLTVSYASSMRAYVQQRSHIQDLKAQIAQRESSIDALEREKRRWHDPAYVQAQARERFGYLMPGETSYVVLGADGKPLESQTSLTDPATVDRKAPTAWWTQEWNSVTLAGVPPKPQAPPVFEIDGTKE
ncbi:cell division protein FtsB [Nocardioides ginsengisegetis]|uniref:Cell division protein FtsB n=1 Tax=Nocardioides ginsengisegetis TaxID=661491 RepID=A0A7W3J1J7_9ACTN|nr:cell division protein FtsB [Nocardioides ginsengisegetis]